MHRHNKLTGSFELDYAGEGGGMEFDLFGEAINSLEAESSNQSETSPSIEADANKSDVVVSKDISKGVFVDSPPSNAVAIDKVRRHQVPAANEAPTKSSSPRETKRTRDDDTNNHITTAQATDDAVRIASDPCRPRSRSSSLSSPPSSPIPPESPPPRGRGKSKEVMKKYYKPMKSKHHERLAWAKENNCDPYTFSDFKDESDVEPPPKRPRSTPRSRRATDSNDEDVVETAPPKKQARFITKKPPKARNAPKGNVHRLQKKEVIAIDDEDEDEEMEDETVASMMMMTNPGLQI